MLCLQKPKNITAGWSQTNPVWSHLTECGVASESRKKNKRTVNQKKKKGGWAWSVYNSQSWHVLNFLKGIYLSLWDSKFSKHVCVSVDPFLFGENWTWFFRTEWPTFNMPDLSKCSSGGNGPASAPWVILNVIFCTFKLWVCFIVFLLLFFSLATIPLCDSCTVSLTMWHTLQRRQTSQDWKHCWWNFIFHCNCL